MGVPPNRQTLEGFSIINHPAMGFPHDYMEPPLKSTSIHIFAQVNQSTSPFFGAPLKDPGNPDTTGPRGGAVPPAAAGGPAAARAARSRGAARRGSASCGAPRRPRWTRLRHWAKTLENMRFSQKFIYFHSKILSFGKLSVLFLWIFSMDIYHQIVSMIHFTYYILCTMDMFKSHTICCFHWNLCITL